MNPVTEHGLAMLRQEYNRLKHTERPKVVDVVSWAASNGDRSENADYHYGKKKLREIDKRLAYLGKQLGTAEVMKNPIDPTKVGFGATVKLLEDDEREVVYQIVGVDEADVDKGTISWKSPLAKALEKAEEGDIIEFNIPSGSREVEVLEINY